MTILKIFFILFLFCGCVTKTNNSIASISDPMEPLSLNALNIFISNTANYYFYTKKICLTQDSINICDTIILNKKLSHLSKEYVVKLYKVFKLATVGYLYQKVDEVIIIRYFSTENNIDNTYFIISIGKTSEVIKVNMNTLKFEDAFRFFSKTKIERKINFISKIKNTCNTGDIVIARFRNDHMEKYSINTSCCPIDLNKIDVVFDEHYYPVYKKTNAN